jgi:hypothetical protein
MFVGYIRKPFSALKLNINIRKSAQNNEALSQTNCTKAKVLAVVVDTTVDGFRFQCWPVYSYHG